MRPLALASLAVFVPALLVGCPAPGMTVAEAGAALEEVGIQAQASQLASGSIEITTNFTIGDAASAAAKELRTFVESQLPCAEIALEENTLTVEYGAKPGNCTYKGQTYSGIHAITISRNEAGEVIVLHTWDKLQNQLVSVTGSATVTWNLKDPSRHVVHELSWTRLSDGREGTGSGDEIQKPLAGGLLEGVVVSGDRSWEGKNGSWDLAIDDVEARWVDPIPQAGAYKLAAPNGKTATLSFTRLDEDSIEARLVTGQDEYTFVVNESGVIEQKNES